MNGSDMMNTQYEILYFIKTCGSETLSIFVDGKPIYKQNSKYSWSGNSGKHRIRIEQVKMFKAKWYWVSAPLMFLLGIFGGDIVFDGKTPFYALYEVNIFVYKNMEVNVNLLDIERYRYEKQGFNYKIEVNFPREVTIEVLRDEFTATKKERIKWFLLHTVLFSLLFGFIIFVGIRVGISSLKIGVGISGAIFSWFLSAMCIIGWIYLIYKLYRYSNTKYIS